MSEIMQRLSNLSAADRAEMRRFLTGEADKDLIQRSLIDGVIREMRVSEASLSNKAYQKALGDVQRAIANLPYERSAGKFPKPHKARTPGKGF